MYLGRVIGTCVAAQKYQGLEGVRLLVVEPVDATGRAVGAPFVAADTVSAGPGEVVFLVGAREASLALQESTPGFVDLLSPSKLTGTFSAQRDDKRARQLYFAVSQLVTNALGRTRYVLSDHQTTTPGNAGG